MISYMDKINKIKKVILSIRSEEVLLVFFFSIFDLYQNP